MDSILKKPGIKYLIRVSSLSQIVNNSININDPNGAFNILFKMRQLHGKILCKFYKNINKKKSNKSNKYNKSNKSNKSTKSNNLTKTYFNNSCLYSVLSSINDIITNTESVFNNYIITNNIDPKTLKIIKSESESDNKSSDSSKSDSSKSDSSKSDSSKSGYLSDFENLKKITNNSNQNNLDTSDSYGDLGDALSDRLKLVKKSNDSKKSKELSNDLPLFNGEVSVETRQRENIKNEINTNLKNFDENIPSLLLFYNPGCPACVKTKPHWDSLISTFKKMFSTNTKLFNIMEINLSDDVNINLANLFQIQYIPTIIMMESSKAPMAKIERLEGMADKKRIKIFIKESFIKFSK